MGTLKKTFKKFDYKKSNELFERAVEVIPNGIYGHFSPAPLIPASAYPFYIEKAEGSRITDVDGNEFIDYMCGYGPMVAGYKNKIIEKAVFEKYQKVDTATGAPEVMVELAEELVNTITIADWAFFAKNGNDVTSYALMVAREHTQRKKIIRLKGGYHGVHPWTQSPDHPGIIFDDAKNIIIGKWNDIDDLKRIIKENKNEIAGLISSPYHHPVFFDNEMPEDGYWQEVEKICRKEGIVLIIDEVRTGFRIDMRGANETFGFKPDLICFSKAMANGYPISALVGTNEIKSSVSKIFYTGSFWFSAVPMVASMETIKYLKSTDGVQKMRQFGKKLEYGLVKIADKHGYNLKVTGHPSMQYYRITDDPTLKLHQKWCAECTQRGAYFTSHHNWFVSTAHNEEDLKLTLDIADDAFHALKS
ncbi:MAG: aminotransferase class III-fold pyridoxal phosphate-dependent enzyme [Bacteroidota bacterium]